MAVLASSRHVWMERTSPARPDFVLIGSLLGLVALGVLMVYSASAVLAMERYQQPYWFLFKQVTWAVVGVFGWAVMMRLDYRNYRQPVVIWSALGVAVVLLVAVLFSPPINGTRRWFLTGDARLVAEGRLADAASSVRPC